MGPMQPCPTHRAQRQAGCPFCQAYSRQHRALRTSGELAGMQPVRKSRAHAHALIAAGMGQLRLAAEASVSPLTLRRIVGRDHWVDDEVVRAGTEATLLAVQLPQALRSGRVDATGFLRRVAAMQLRGWRDEDLAGLTESRLSMVAYRARGNGYVTGAVAASMAAAYVLTYGQLGPHGPVSHPVARHKLRQHYPDAAWTPATIDNPRARPACGPGLPALPAGRP